MSGLTGLVKWEDIPASGDEKKGALNGIDPWNAGIKRGLCSGRSLCYLCLSPGQSLSIACVRGAAVAFEHG